MIEKLDGSPLEATTPEDQEFIETFEKQTEVKLDSTGINNEKRT